MAEYSAKLSNLRISPRKVRLVADLVRSKPLDYARMQLKYSPKRASVSLLKLLNSAASNAKDINKEIDESTLYIKRILVDEGRVLKRYRPVSRGSAHEIQKKMTHVVLVLSEKEQTERSKPKVKKTMPAGKQAKEKVKAAE